MRAPDTDTLLFFSGHMDALELYLTLEETIYDVFPNVNRRLHRSPIFCF